VRPPLADLDAVGQAALVQRGEVTPRELVLAAIERIETADGALNCVPVHCFEQALESLREAPARAPFAGVPFLLKDVGAQQADLPYYAANRALMRVDHRSPADNSFGARLRRTGVVTLGKSNTPEFGLQSTTQPFAFGPTRNPWDRERTPGGSSGGACAAVAAGLVPVAHASDGAGSIRIPAAWCGIVGLKPSRGRISRGPEATSLTTVEFVVARSLRDTAALLDALEGNEPGDLYTLPGPARPYATALEQAPRSLRVGLLTEMPGGRVDPECAGAAESAAGALESLGHCVERAWPQALFEGEERSLHAVVFGPVEHRACLDELEGLLGRPVRPDDVEPFLWELAHMELPSVSAEDYLQAGEWMQAWAGRVVGWWRKGYDLLLTPTTGERAPQLEHLDGHSVDPQTLVERMGPHMAFTEPFNVTGQPAITLPLYADSRGMPLGVQLVADVGREDLLLQTAAQLEGVLPWAERRPGVHA